MKTVEWKVSAHGYFLGFITAVDERQAKLLAHRKYPSAQYLKVEKIWTCPSDQIAL